MILVVPPLPAVPPLANATPPLLVENVLPPVPMPPLLVVAPPPVPSVPPLPIDDVPPTFIAPPVVSVPRDADVELPLTPPEC